MSTSFESNPSERREIKEAYRADVELVDRCVTGCRLAWLTLIERYERTLYYAVLNTLRSFGAHAPTDRVEDIQADLMVVLVKDDFRKLRKYSGRCKLEHWLKVVAGNYTIDLLRKARPTVSLDGESEASRALRRTLPDTTESSETAIARAELMGVLRGLYGALPDEDRRFVELFYQNELGFEEIAEIMETTIGAVYARKNRVRKKLLKLAASAGYA